MQRFGRFIGNLVVALMMLGILGVVAAGVVFYHYSQDLPDHSQLAKYDPPTITRLYAADGRLLAEYAKEKRVYVPLTAMPKRLIHAFLATEDKNFYRHTGVDIFGILRAVRENFRNYGQSHSLVGGSTITQQVVKNFLLTNEQSIERKVKEAILAFRISQVYSKDRILELYLNQIYLGMSSYGVAAASLNYFNKSMDELTVEEAAFLASMPKAPSSYNPLHSYERAKTRRDWAIGRMEEDGYITREEAEHAIAMPITLRTRDETEVAQAEFFAEEVRRQLVGIYGADVLYQGGLYVKTTLAPSYQKFADAALRSALVAYDRRHGYRGPVAHTELLADWQKAVTKAVKEKSPLIPGQSYAVVTEVKKDGVLIELTNGYRAMIPLSELKWARKDFGELRMGPEVQEALDVLHRGDIVITQPAADPSEKDTKAKKGKMQSVYSLEQVPAVNGALVAMDPHTGKVLAMSGGYSLTGFNRATQAKRQPGSSFKPFVYLAGLEKGMTPSTILIDEPVELSQGSGMPTWKPQNYKDDYLGPATMRVGLEKSRNAMTVRLALMTGIDKVLRVGKRFGIYDEVPRNFSVVLGAAETTLLRIANAYCSIVNGGFKVSPQMIERIDDRNGKTIYRRDQRQCNGCMAVPEGAVSEAVPPLPADERERILDARVAYQMVSMLQGVVERGTATKAKSVGKPLAGKTGTTNESRDTWFVGFSPDLVVGTYIGFDTPKSMGKKETGGSVALPGFIDFMTHALADKPSTPFRMPPGIQLVRVDLKSGQPATEGDKLIYEAFRTGGDIFLPEKEKAEEQTVEESSEAPGEAAAPNAGAVPAASSANDLPWQSPSPSGGALPQPFTPNSPPTQRPPAGKDGSVHGTGGLY